MRARKTLTTLLFALTLGSPAFATATTIDVGVVRFDTFIAGPGGVNAFFASNLTGDPSLSGFALPPDFPVATFLVFNAPQLIWSGPAGSPFDFNHAGIVPGNLDPDPAIQFPDTDLFTSATFTASLSQPLFQLTDGRFFQAISSSLTGTIVDAAGSLAPGDFAVLSVDAVEVKPTGTVPEPASLTLVATALALWRVRSRSRMHRQSDWSR